MHILDEILLNKTNEIRSLKRKYSVSSFNEMEFFNSECLNFSTAVMNNKNLSVIAEIKKASPSKGVIREHFNFINIAEVYFSQNVTAISVLTDGKYFQGKPEYLEMIAKFKAAPILRKDFIIDEIQIFESKAIGADIILLIAEALSKNQIRDYTQTASEIGMEVLLELHSFQQLDKIDFGINKIIGINNRNLNDFSVDINTTLLLRSLLPQDSIVISESGINNRIHIELLKSNNIDGILIGEHLMKSNELEQELGKIMKWCNYEG